MMKKTALAFSLALLSSSILAVEVMSYKRLPLPVRLAVDQERIIFVDRNVRVGTPRSLQGKLRVQSVAGAIYLRASEAIEPTRIQLQDKESGEIILLDIATTTDGANLESIKIVNADDAMPANRGKQSPDSGTADTSSHTPVSSKTPMPLALTRHAAQMMYAPLRAVEPLPGVRPIPLRVKGPLTTLLPTLDVSAVPLAAWSIGQWTVTAVRITNKRQQRQHLDPRFLQGDLYAASFQHAYLGSAGSAEDTTIAYLVTRDKGLESALLPPSQEQPHEK